MYIKPIIIASLLALSTAGAVTYNFNGKINGISDQSYFPDTGYISPPALAPYGIRFGTPFHGSLTIDLSTLYPDLGFGLPGVLGSSTDVDCRA